MAQKRDRSPGSFRAPPPADARGSGHSSDSPSRSAGSAASSTLSAPVRYATIGAISAATLASELLLTRVLSYVYWNHVVYLLVTLCLLGYGVASTGLSVAQRWVERQDDRALLGGSLVGFAASLLVTLLALAHLGTSDTGDLFRPASILRLLAVYGVATLPFVFAGVVVLRLLSSDPARIGALYGVDLVGAAAGSVLFLVLIEPLGAPRALALLAALTLVLAVVVARGLGTKGRRLQVAIAVTLLGASAGVAAPDRVFPLRVEQTKLLAAADRTDLIPDARREVGVWTPLMRIDVAYSPSGAIDRILEPNPLDHRVLTHDGDAATAILHRDESWPGPEDRRPDRPRGPAELAFTLKERPEVLVIGVGGGRDLGLALQNGAKHVDAVELNRATVALMTGSGPYAAYNGRLYERPEVHVEVGEGRSALRRSDKRYDLIQMSGVDTYAALSSGAYVLAENYLYTVEAVSDFLDHLEPDGVMNIWRWYEWEQPRETLRVMSLVLEALRRHGAKDPGAHVFVAAQAWGGATVFKKSPFTPDEIARLRRTCEENGIIVIHSPDLAGMNPYDALKNPFYALAETYRSGRERQFFAGYPFDVSPVTDDRPFFYEYLRVGKVFEGALMPEGTWGHHALRSYWSYVVMASNFFAATLATALFVWLPLRAARRRGRLPPRRFAAAGFFSAIGLGFIALEVGLTQRLVLYLGHPMHAIAVVITTLLAATGVGSFVADRRADPRAVVRAGVVLLAAWLAIYFGPARLLLDATLGASLPLRVLATVLVVAPLGAVLGLFFPSGLRIVSARAADLVPWAWGINAGFTVIGSVATIVVAIGAGFSKVIAGSVMLYVLGALALERFAGGDDVKPASPAIEQGDP